MLARLKAMLLPWVCVFVDHDYPNSPQPTTCRRCGQSSTSGMGD
jgi:hypothetical protein